MKKLPPKPIVKIEATRRVCKFALRHKKGELLELEEFFSTMLLYAMSIEGGELNRLLELNMAEVLKDLNTRKNFDA